MKRAALRKDCDDARSRLRTDFAGWQAEPVSRRLWVIPSSVRGPLAALLLPLAVILVGALVNLGPFGPPSLFLLVVVVAAAGGGLWSGLAAAVISFLGLNYFFTPPRHTFRVDKPADLVALFVFIGVGAIVGVLFARVVSERDRVERREEEMRLVNRFATRLLSAELSRHVLREVAGTL